MELKNRFTTMGHSAALTYAATELERAGWQKAIDAPIILLPIPSIDQNGNIKGGGSIDDIPEGRLIVGGNLNQAALKKHRCLDLLQNPLYLSENAMITAYCAVCIVMENLPVTLQDCPILVAGWGRIGKCLCKLLRQLNARVTVAARKEPDRALAEALGYGVMDIGDQSADLTPYRVILNTIPAPIFSKERLANCNSACLMVDLASAQGIDSPKAIWAKGLPNLDAPESSGKLIAKILRKELEI